MNDAAETDYQLWRHHPVSKIFLQYLKDYASVLEREAIEQWKSGALVLSVENEMRGRVLTLQELAELPFASMREFYDTGEKAQEDEK